MGYSQLAKKPTRQKSNSPNSKSPKNQLAKFWSTRQKVLVNSPNLIEFWFYIFSITKKFFFKDRYVYVYFLKWWVCIQNCYCANIIDLTLFKLYNVVLTICFRMIVYIYEFSRSLFMQIVQWNKSFISCPLFWCKVKYANPALWSKHSDKIYLTFTSDSQNKGAMLT